MILVTGGAGFIGSNLVAELEDMGIQEEVVVVDRLGTGDKWKNLENRKILLNIIHPEDLFDFLENNKQSINIIVHMGAISQTTEKDVDLIIRSNLKLSCDLWDFCKRNNVRFIYASSAATYGDGSMGFKDVAGTYGYYGNPATMLGEESGKLHRVASGKASYEYISNLKPLNPYGWSKSLFDRIVLNEYVNYLKLGKFESSGYPQVVGLKFFNVYGPNEYHKGNQQSVVANIFNQIQQYRVSYLFKSHNKNYKDGMQERDFVWVGDCAKVIKWFIENPSVSGIFNVGSGKARTFKDLAELTWKALGLKPKIKFVKMPESLRDQYQYSTQADLTGLESVGCVINKSKSVFSTKPRSPFIEQITSLEEGVTKYVQEYLVKENKFL